VFKIFGPFNFLSRQCSGNVTLAQSLIRQLRSMAVAAGVGNPLIGGGWITEKTTLPGHGLYQGIDVDYTGNYNAPSRSKLLGPCDSSETILPWQQMADDNDGSQWGNHSRLDSVPWVPIVDASWDTRPEGNISGRCTFGQPTLPQWQTFLEKVKAVLLAPGARLGYPLGDGDGVQPAVTIYAWNEYQLRIIAIRRVSALFRNVWHYIRLKNK
jgi:hypothetical protein